VRVDVRLVSTEDGRVLWASNTYDRPVGDIFTIQDEIARNVVALRDLDSGEQVEVPIENLSLSELRARLQAFYG